MMKQETKRNQEETVRLEDFDIILVNTSAGKDSQAMLTTLVSEAEELGIKDRLIAVHAELEEEWEGTKELAKEQADFYGVPIAFVKRPESLLTQIEKRGMWPSSTTRYCTSDHKRDQIAKVITRLAKESQKPTPRILNCLGIRAQESPARSKKNPYQRDHRTSSGRKDVWTYYPIFDYSETEVWATIKASGVPHHYAYDLGMPRLSCCFCVFAPKPALILAGKHNRELLERYVAVEKRIGHTFRKDFRIAKVLEAIDADQEKEFTGAMEGWNM